MDDGKCLDEPEFVVSHVWRARGLFARLEVYPREFDLVPTGAKLLTGTGLVYEMLSLQFKECLLNVARL